MTSMQTVIQVTPTQLKKITDYYANMATGKQPTGAIFVAKKGPTTITAYRSGKVMFQGANYAQEAARWQTPAQQNTTRQATGKQATTPGVNIPQGFANWSVLGSDEVGAGAYFGPLTTAAVYVPKDQLAWVRQLGIADSKTLTDAKMRQIAPEIIANLPHHVVNLMPEKYNQMQPTNNVNQMKAISHNFVLGKVLAKIAPTTPDAILIDQLAQASTYFKYLTQAQQSPIIKDNVYFTT